MVMSLLAAERSDAALIRNLFQFYYYDFSEIVGGHAGVDGKFSPPSIESYWQDSWRYPQILRVDGHPAGFALIHRRSRLSGDSETWDVAEFFVMRAYRRQGVGSHAALRTFEKFRGRWEVRQVRANEAATHFWRAVIARHTGGRYAESNLDDERWRGPVQTFDNTAM